MLSGRAAPRAYMQQVQFLTYPTLWIATGIIGLSNRLKYPLSLTPMRHLTGLGLAAWLGLALPIVPQLLAPPAAIAQSLPTGEFQNSSWRIVIRYSNNALTYYGESLNDGSSIFLSGASRSGSTWTWNNAGTRYSVTWRNNSDSIRLRVSQNGRTLLNQTLSRTSY